MTRLGALVGASAVFAALVVTATAGGSSTAPPQVRPVSSLEPAKTARQWRALVRRRATDRTGAAALPGCRPLRAVFYTASDWLRLATTLAGAPSPCADYFVSIPPLVSDKTRPRPDQAWRIRALGPRFHALAEVHLSSWAGWVAATAGATWYDAGVEARRRMSAAGYGAGDGWALNELSSAVRRGEGSARADVRAFVRGLHDGPPGAAPSRGVVFTIGMGQRTADLSVYKANLQSWLLDSAFWADMAAYVADWSQEVYGDYRSFGVPGSTLADRRAHVGDYVHHPLALASAAPPEAAAARAFLQASYAPLANAAWQWESGFGWTAVAGDQMRGFVSAQVAALRGANGAADRFGFAWAPKNLSGASDFTAETAAILGRLAAAIRDSGDDGEDPGAAACGADGALCGGELAGSQFTEAWKTFATWGGPALALAPPAALVAGAASPPLAVQLTSSPGVPATATAPVAVTLATSSPGGSFALAPDGPWSASLQLEIPAGASSTAPFHYRDTRAGDASVTASAAGLLAATVAVHVDPAVAAALTLSPAAASVPQGATLALVASAADPFGNAVAPTGAAWVLTPGTAGTLTATDGSGTFRAAAGATGTATVSVSLPAGASVLSSTSTVTLLTATRVASVVYTRLSGRLRVTATVVDGAARAVPGASVSFRVTRNGANHATGTATTGAAGAASITYTSPRGCYSTKITGVVKSGSAWSGTTPANSICI